MSGYVSFSGYSQICETLKLLKTDSIIIASGCCMPVCCCDCLLLLYLVMFSNFSAKSVAANRVPRGLGTNLSA